MTPADLARLHAATCSALEAGPTPEEAQRLRERYAEACLEAGLERTAEGWLGSRIN